MRASAKTRLFATAALAYAVSGWASLLVTSGTADLAAIWLANAVILGFALRRPPQALPLLLGAALAGGTALALVFGDGAMDRTVGMLAAGCNAFEIALVFALLRRFGLTPGQPIRGRGLLVFLLGCVLAAPALSGALGAWLLYLQTGAPWTALWLDWWRADAFGLFVGLPLAWAYRRDSMRRLLIGEQAFAFWTLAIATIVITVLALAFMGHPFTIIALPLIAVALRTGAAGTAVCSLLMVASVLLAVTLQLRGVLPGSGALHEGALFELWLYSCIAAVAPLVVGFLTEQRMLDRTRVEQAKARLQAITDTLPAYVAELGPDLRYRFVNAMYQTSLGIAPAQIIGRTPRDILGDATADRLRPHMDRARQGHREHFEFELDDGTVLEATYEPLADSGGFLVLSQDVTWRQEADRRVRQLLESMPDAMLVVDAPSRRIVLVNEAAERMFGARRNALLGQPLGRFIEHCSALAALDARAPDCGVSADDAPVELTGMRDDGSRFPMEALLRHLPVAEGMHCVLTLRDITARRAAEQALQHERERAQVTLDSISDAVITYCNRRVITSLNPIAEDLLGWPRGEAVGALLDDVIRLVRAADDAPIAWQPDRSPGTAPVIHEATGVLQSRDGGRLRVTLSDAPLTDEAGHVIGGVVVIRDVSQSHAMAERMAYLAQHDHLTGLPNRAVLDERLAELLAHVADRDDRAVCGALLFLDLDLFKRINDSLGHQAGDSVLRAVAGRLRNTVRATDTVSRQGGDEFVVLLPQLPSREHAGSVAASMIRAIEAPIGHEGHTLHVSASIGIAILPEHGRDAETLTKHADSALYDAKRMGRGRFSYFDVSMSARANRRLRMETELRAAVADGRLFVEYQPKVAMPARVLCGTEALVRWQRGDGQVVLPSDFVPVAEETGLITAIDEWVMQAACRQARAWLDAGLPPLPVSVNVSLARLDPERLLRTLRAALDDAALPSGLLEIEFTESQMLGQHDRARRLVDSIRDLGVRLAVDDFGTGYSSLSYLTEYRFDTIKIDRAFVHGLPDEREPRAIARAIVGMGDSLGCSVIAEGVESPAQAAILLELGCTQMQGFLFAPPLGAAQLESHLRSGLH